MTQNAPPPQPARTRPIALALLALLAAVFILNLIVGLPQFILYGLVGGLVFCLIIVGRDALLAAQRTLDTPPPHEPPERSDRE